MLVLSISLLSNYPSAQKPFNFLTKSHYSAADRDRTVEPTKEEGAVLNAKKPPLIVPDVYLSRNAQSSGDYGGGARLACEYWQNSLSEIRRFGYCVSICSFVLVFLFIPTLCRFFFAYLRRCVINQVRLKLPNFWHFVIPGYLFHCRGYFWFVNDFNWSTFNAEKSSAWTYFGFTRFITAQIP